MLSIFVTLKLKDSELEAKQLIIFFCNLLVTRKLKFNHQHPDVAKNIIEKDKKILCCVETEELKQSNDFNFQ